MSKDTLISKRTIKPSKGGRTARAPEARLTPGELDGLRFVLVNRGLSFADWLVEKVKEDVDLIGRVAAATKQKPIGVKR